MTIARRIKPIGGFSKIVHLVLLLLLPLLVFVFVRLRFYEMATLLILLSKWRMFAVKPRHWFANIRANAVDLMVGLSLLIFMVHSGSQMMQLIWAALYAAWLIWLKPRSGLLSVASQGFAAQTLSLTAIFVHWGDAPIFFWVLLAWGICYLSARHFFSAFDEPLGRFLSSLWGFFAASLLWILGHLTLFYGVIAQATLLLTVISFGMASIYYLEHGDRLSLMLRRQVVFVMVAIVVIVLVFSDWGNKAI